MNLMVDRARVSHREVLAGDALAGISAANEALWVDDTDFDRDPEWQKLAAATKDFVAGLPEDERQFVELRFTEEHSQYEVAAKLGATRGKVRQIENKVQRALRGYLQKLGLFHD